MRSPVDINISISRLEGLEVILPAREINSSVVSPIAETTTMTFLPSLLDLITLSAAFIPVFSEELGKNKKKSFEVASSVLNLLVLIFLIFGVLIILFSRPLSGLIAAGFSEQQTLLMSGLMKIIVLSQIFFLLSNFLTSILQTYQRFLVPALAPMVYNLGIIIGIQILSPYFGIWGPALGVLLGSVFHFAVQLPLVVRIGFKYFPVIDFKLAGVKKMLSLMPPRTIALGIREFQSTIILIVGSSLTAGHLSLFYLGQRLTGFFSRVFGVTIGQASLPVLSREASTNKQSQYAKTLTGSLLQAVFLALPTAVIFLILRIPLVRLAYGAKDFPWKATLITGQVIAFLVPLVVSGTINDILGRGFYALQDTKTPLIISWISLFIFIGIAVGYEVFGRTSVIGLALASSFSSLIQSLILLLVLFKKIKMQIYRQIITPLIKMFFSSLLGGITVWILLRILDNYVFDTTRISGLIGLTTLSSLGGIFIYLVLGLSFQLKEARAIIKLLKSIIIWPREILPLQELPPRPD